ncbi:hypothetical protein GCM10009429_21090 [Dyella marensis]
MWLGNAIGSSIGFLALVLGALLNAHLNRRRDDRMRGENVDSVLAAAVAELIAMSLALKDRLGYLHWFVHQPNPSADVEAVAARCAPPISIVLDKIGGQLGLLDPKTTGDVVRFWYELQLLRNLLQASLIELRGGVLNQNVMHERAGRANDLYAKIDELADRLNGTGAKFVLADADELRKDLAMKPGTYHAEWVARKIGAAQP